MSQLEIEMNMRVTERAPGTCADYLGYCDIERGEGGQLYQKQLTHGLWIAWSFQTRNTLEKYMQLSTYPTGLLEALGQSPSGGALLATQTVLQRLLTMLNTLHVEKFIHRDVKPSNILVLEGDKTGLRLIDLGACADLTDGFNFILGNCPRDPGYCPPECDLMPAEVGEGNRVPKEQLGSFWDKYTPSSFDIYSAGIILMQMAVPALSKEVALKTFNAELNTCGHDLMKWKAQTELSAEESEVLDANNGAGWKLAASMLQKPTWTFRDQDGETQNASDKCRPTAAEALKHPFFK